MSALEIAIRMRFEKNIEVGYIFGRPEKGIWTLNYYPDLFYN
jgi:hypothetical protein